MTLTTLLVGAVTVALLGMIYRALPKSTAGGVEARSIDWIAFLLLTLHITLPYVWLEERDSGTTLVEEGLTGPNVAIIMVTFASLAYVVMLGLTGRLPVSWVLDRRFKPIFFLIGVYALSVLWSVYPVFSAFRVLEHFTFVCLAIHVFLPVRTSDDLASLLTIIIVVWLVALSATIMSNLQAGIYYSFAKDNLFPAISAIALLLAMQAHGHFRYLIALVAVFGFLAGGSASTAGLLCLCLLLYFLYSRLLALRVIGASTFPVVAVAVAAFAVSPEQFEVLTDFISSVLQKPEAEILTATGRYSIWEAFWSVSKDNPIGTGFGSERFIQLLSGNTDLVRLFGRDHLNLNSAHNGMLSAWIAAGWMGLFALFLVYGSAIATAVRAAPQFRAVATASIVLLIFNSQTTLGIGSFYNLFWIPWIGILCLAGERKDELAPRRAAGHAAKATEKPLLER